MVSDWLRMRPAGWLTHRVSIRFEVRGGFRPCQKASRSLRCLFQSALRFAVVSDELRLAANHWDRAMFQSALRFAVVSDELNLKQAPFRVLFQSALRFAVVSDRWENDSQIVLPFKFQSALRFAVVSDPTPWHAVLTSPVAAVLHTTPLHPLQQADRTCPKWGKTPSQVAYTPEAVFGRSPTTPVRGCLQNPRLRAAGIAGFFQPYPHTASRPVLPGVGGSGSGRILHITV